MPAPRHALIAAAGVGSRLGLGMPKCLVTVGGRRIVDYLLDALADVPEVRMVVGFREHDVMTYVRARRRDVLFVRNPAFLHTTTLESLHLGARGLTAPALILDGDTIYDRGSLRRMREMAADGAPVVGVSATISTDPVYASVRTASGGGLEVTGFSRAEASRHEWANVAVVPPSLLARASTHVYERLAKELPLRAALIERLEIDTEEDLRRAEAELAGARETGGTVIPFPRAARRRRRRERAAS